MIYSFDHLKRYHIARSGNNYPWSGYNRIKIIDNFVYFVSWVDCDFLLSLRLYQIKRYDLNNGTTSGVSEWEEKRKSIIKEWRKVGELK